MTRRYFLIPFYKISDSDTGFLLFSNYVIVMTMDKKKCLFLKSISDIHTLKRSIVTKFPIKTDSI